MRKVVLASKNGQGVKMSTGGIREGEEVREPEQKEEEEVRMEGNQSSHEQEEI